MSFSASLEELVAQSASGLVGAAARWKRVPLRNVAKVVNGFPFQSEFFAERTGTPVIRIRDVTAGQAGTFYTGPIPTGFWVNRGDIVIGMDGDFNCRIWEAEKALLNQRVCKIEPDVARVDKRFLAYALPGYLSLINESTHSITVKHLSSKTIGQIPLPLPEIVEQQQIAAKLDELFARSHAAREELTRVPRLVERYKQNLLVSAFRGDLTENWRKEQRVLFDDNWRTMSLRELSLDVRYGTAAKCHDEPKATPVLRIPNVAGGKISTTDLKYASFDHKEIEKLSLRVGDLLIIRSNGSLGLVGRAALVTTETAGYLYAGYLIRIRLDTNLVVPEFLLYALQEPSVRSSIERLAKSTSGVNNINSEQLRMLHFHVPLVAEQREIVTQIDNAFKRIENLKFAAEKAANLIGGLERATLAKAFRGELVEATAQP